MKEISAVEKKAIRSNRLKFIEMAKVINVYLKEEKLSLNFLGYTETIKEYLSMSNIDFDKLGSLTLELNLWSDYFGQLQGLIELKMLKYENKTLYFQSFYDKKVPNEKLENQIRDIKKRFAHFKLFLKHIETQRKMFEQAHKHCLKGYTEALSNLLYKYND